MNNGLIKITRHALERVGQLKIGEAQLQSAWDRSILVELSKKQKEYKFKKYGLESLKTQYYWDDKSGILFTVQVNEEYKNFKKSENWTLLTVTKGKGNLKGGAIRR